MLVDISTPRAPQSSGCCRAARPPKLCHIVSHLNVVEMMMALQKMRARRTPGNQAHVTNWRENPVLMAADAAEAARRGFDELETTCRVARMAPFNALALLVGSQTVPHGGVLTQCAVEEALNLRLGLKGLTTYAETLSVYGTDDALRDGDDTPWSKGLLASAYASRGIKIRFTSGTGSETLMGYEDGKSMLYLEGALPRCMVKGAGRAGRAERSDFLRRPDRRAAWQGVRAVLAENLIAAALGLEVASRQRRDVVAFRHAQGRQADAAIPARHRFRHLGLLLDAAARQHVRRRQFRRRRSWTTGWSSSATCG
jgi:propanediol dehydratase large subunit